MDIGWHALGRWQLTAVAALVLPALRKLDLGRNKLEMDEAVKVGALAPGLVALRLADNPVADAGDYRLEMAVCARTLRALDDMAYEAEELQEAAEVRPACVRACALVQSLTPVATRALYIAWQLRKSRKPE